MGQSIQNHPINPGLPDADYIQLAVEAALVVALGVEACLLHFNVN